MTHQREKLQAALELLKTPSDARATRTIRMIPTIRIPVSRHGGGTQLYDAVYLASNELMKKQPGRKAVIILSDGVDRGSKTSLEGAIEVRASAADTVDLLDLLRTKSATIAMKRPKARRRNGGDGGGYPAAVAADGPVAAVDIRVAADGRRSRGGQQRRSEEPHTDGKKILERISKETGGRFFEVTKKETVGDIYDSIVEELRTQYSMGFTPDKDSCGEGYHHIQLCR